MYDDLIINKINTINKCIERIKHEYYESENSIKLDFTANCRKAPAFRLWIHTQADGCKSTAFVSAEVLAFAKALLLRQPYEGRRLQKQSFCACRSGKAISFLICFFPMYLNLFYSIIYT